MASPGRGGSFVMPLTEPQNALITLKSGRQPPLQYSQRQACPQRCCAAAEEILMRRETSEGRGCLFYSCAPSARALLPAQLRATRDLLAFAGGFGIAGYAAK